MKLNQLQYFVAVCQHLNISNAAKELHVSQPTISSAIHELEKEFGLNLLYRNSKNISLTAEGRFLYSRAKDLIESATILQKQMQDMGANKNEIRIGLPPMIGSALYPSLIKDFHKKYPDIYTDIYEQGSTATIDMVLKGSLDIAIVVIDDIKKSKSINIVPIFDTEVLYCTNKKPPFSEKGAINLHAVKNQPIVMYKEGYFLRNALLNRYNDLKITPHIALYSNQLYTTKNLVISGIASAFLLKEIVLQEPQLYGVPLEDPLYLHIGLIWKTDSYLYSDVANFISFAKRYSYSY